MADYLLDVQLVGADRMKAALKSSPYIVGQQLSWALNTSARGLRDMAAGNAPYKTGNLKTSIHVEDSSPFHLEAKVGTNIVYGRAQEYGTVGWPISTRYGQYYGNIKPKYYMRDAVNDYRPVHTANLQNAVTSIIKGLGF